MSIDINITQSHYEVFKSIMEVVWMCWVTISIFILLKKKGSG